MKRKLKWKFIEQDKICNSCAYLLLQRQWHHPHRHPPIGSFFFLSRFRVIFLLHFQMGGGREEDKFFAFVEVKEIHVDSKTLRLTAQLECYRTSFSDCIVRHLELNVLLLVCRFGAFFLHGYGISSWMDLHLSCKIPNRLFTWGRALRVFFILRIFFLLETNCEWQRSRHRNLLSGLHIPQTDRNDQIRINFNEGEVIATRKISDFTSVSKN